MQRPAVVGGTRVHPGHPPSTVPSPGLPHLHTPRHLGGVLPCGEPSWACLNFSTPAPGPMPGARPLPPTFDNPDCPQTPANVPESRRIPDGEVRSPRKTDKTHDRILEREALGPSSGREQWREHPQLWGEPRRPGGVPRCWPSTTSMKASVNPRTRGTQRRAGGDAHLWLFPPFSDFYLPLFPPSLCHSRLFVNKCDLGFPKLLPGDPDTQKGHRLPLWQPDALSQCHPSNPVHVEYSTKGRGASAPPRPRPHPAQNVLLILSPRGSCRLQLK